jgi:hypothetical protein
MNENLVNERRERMKREMELLFTEWEYREGEIYPFKNIMRLQDRLIQTTALWGMKYIGYKPFGETITFGWEWPEEGVVCECNINPPMGPGFRVSWLWR